MMSFFIRISENIYALNSEFGFGVFKAESDKVTELINKYDIGKVKFLAPVGEKIGNADDAVHSWTAELFRAQDQSSPTKEWWIEDENGNMIQKVRARYKCPFTKKTWFTERSI